MDKIVDDESTKKTKRTIILVAFVVLALLSAMVYVSVSAMYRVHEAERAEQHKSDPVRPQQR